jgi:hypothetical protein
MNGTRLGRIQRFIGQATGDIYRLEIIRPIARAIMVTPPGSAHGDVLGDLILALGRGGVRADADANVRAAWWLVSTGQTPTARAVASRLASQRAHTAHEAQIRELAAEADAIARRDGPAIAEWRIARLRETGSLPTWRAVCREFGFPPSHVGLLVNALAERTETSEML